MKSAYETEERKRKMLEDGTGSHHLQPHTRYTVCACVRVGGWVGAYVRVRSLRDRDWRKPMFSPS